MAEFTKERIIEELKASTQNANGMFEISEDNICALMSMLTYAAPQLPQPAVPVVNLPSEFYSQEGVMVQLEKVMAALSVRGIDYQRKGDACRAAMLQGAAGNSPVIPDGWVACSERMPEDDDFVHIWPRPDFGVELHVGQYCECHPKGDGWYAQVYEQNYGIEWYPIAVTHWMPLPAAPQQEVKSALEMGMARYGDAMQELAKKEVN